MSETLLVGTVGVLIGVAIGATMLLLHVPIVVIVALAGGFFVIGDLISNLERRVRPDPRSPVA